MSADYKHSTPEEALQQVKEITPGITPGKLKIFIGYAAGVGKTYSMLNEANRRLKRGENIVIGYLESHGRKETDAQVADLEIIPRKKVHYNGLIMEEMDTEAIIKKNPTRVIIDELAHTNVPGSKYAKRYEDIQEILDNGIHVISTLNIQHLESLNDIVEKITGVPIKETIPDRIVDQADEVVVIDITPNALRNRLTRGNIYQQESASKALKNFFRKENLNALRELALRQTAEEVDEELEEYLKEQGLKENWHVAERVMVCISPTPSAKKLIRKGARIAKRYHCEWTVVTVHCTHLFAPRPTEKDLQILENNLKLATQLGASVVKLTGKSISNELADYAESKHITRIIIGHDKRTFLQTLVRGSTLSKLLKRTKDIEFHVIPNDLK